MQETVHKRVGENYEAKSIGAKTMKQKANGQGPNH